MWNIYTVRTLVTVNGEIETRKRRKIVAGDIIEVGGETLQVALRDQ